MLSFHSFRRLLNLFGFRTGRPPRTSYQGREIEHEPEVDSQASQMYDWFKSQLDIGQDRSQLYREYKCLPGDISISLVDGTEVQIQDLVGRDPFWVYSYDHRTGKIVPGKATAIPTRKNAELVEVELDNGEKVRCTPDHPWMLRDGSYKRADEFQLVERLLGLYRKYNCKLLPTAPNHKVVAVRKLEEREDCYDLQVEEYHNFGLTAGVFVHNSMDDGDICSSALDLYAEDATQLDPATGKTLWVVAGNSEIEKIASNTLEVVDTEGSIFAIARGLAKYGDHFEGLLMGAGENDVPNCVSGMKAINPLSVSRVEDSTGRLLGFRVAEIAEEVEQEELPQPSIQAADITLPWDIIHFRLMASSSEEEKYGTALIASSRRVYRYLRLMEESLVIYRLRRAPDRLKWKIYVGSASPEEATSIVNTFRNRLRKKMATDPDTGLVKSELNPMSLDEDFFLPFSDGPGQHDVDVMKGSTDVGEVLDIDYMRKRLFSCLRIPPDYMGFEEAGGTLSGRAPLSDQDVRFARGEKRLQRALMEGFITLIKIDMLLRGLDVEAARNQFSVRMHPVSFLEELQRVEVAKTRAEIVATLIGTGKELGADKAKWVAYVAQQSGFPIELLKVVQPRIDRATSKADIEKILIEALVEKLQDMPGANELRSENVRLSFRARSRKALLEEIEKRQRKLEELFEEQDDA